MNACTVSFREQRSWNAWPAPRTAVVGDWLLRSCGGYTKRANSANALRASAALDTDVLAGIENFYRYQQQKSIFRISPLADTQADALLQAHGYGLIEVSDVMARATLPSDAALTLPAGMQIQVQAQCTGAWFQGCCDASGLSSESRVGHRNILQAIAMPTGFATMYWQDQAVAWGMAVLERQAMGLYDVVVLPKLRGLGAGRALLQGLLRWAAEQGALSVDLQVRGDNLPALTLYKSLGFLKQYSYHYRVKEL